MSNKIRKILAMILSFCMMVTGFSISISGASIENDSTSKVRHYVAKETKTTSSSAIKVETTSAAAIMLTQASDEEYLIYPLPREIKYNTNGFEIGDKVNVVYGDSIDSYTKNHLAEALSKLQNSPAINEVSSPVNGQVNILVGVKGSGDAADNALKDIDTNMTIDNAGVSKTASIFDDDSGANDAYIIRVSDDGIIAVLGKDTDAAFYGVTTLKHIFAQMSQNGTDTIRTFTIRDYASVPYRGFIEGYYGIPWSHENRKSLMEWGGEWKMNAYVFAPKDDPYHNSKWRELYPQEDLAKIQELAQTGNRTKNRYVYALHCFMNQPFNFENFDNDLNVVLSKFEQLYAVGVRQFAILADDSGGSSAENLSKLMNAINKWREKYPDVYPLMFCPDSYNASWVNDGYNKLTNLNQKMDDDIEIFWTGQGVCGHASKAGGEAFTNGINNLVNSNPSDNLTKPARKSLMWLNWPVDDINMSRLIMGPGSNEGGSQYWNNDGVAILSKGEADYYSGIISNPMQQAQLNKVPLFAIADFAWNDDDYNGQQSWEDSFQFVDPQGGSALREMARHLSDPDPNTHKMICGESENIKEKLEKFLNDYQAGKSIIEQSDSLISEFDKIINACDMLPKLSKNKGLLDEIEAHRLSLREISNSSKYFIKTAIALEKNNVNDVWSNYSKATSELSNSTVHEVKTLDGFKYAESGSKRIIPFANKMSELLEDPVKSIIDPDYIPQAKIAFYKDGIGGWYSGSERDIIDGNTSTLAWTNAEQAEGGYFGITYSIPVTISNFRVLTGDAPNNTGDALSGAVLEYKSEGDTEYKIAPNGEFSGGQEWDFSASPLQNVVDMRVRITTASDKWLKIREIGTYKKQQQSTANGTVFRSSDIVFGSNNESAYGPDSKVTDGDDSTYAHYGSGSSGNANIPEGAYIGLDFGKPIKLGVIRVLQGNGSNDDRMSNATLEYSIDGETYTEIATNLNQNEIIIDKSNDNISAQYIRLRNGSGCETWLALRTFEVVYPEATGTKIYTNTLDYVEMTAKVDSDSASINVGTGKTITLQPKEYIGIKLPRIRNIISMSATFTEDSPILEAGANEFEMKSITPTNISEANPINARYIRLINNTSSPITFNLTELSVTSKEIYTPSLVESTMGSEQDEDNTVANLFDGNLNNEAIFVGLQGKDKYAIIDIGQQLNIKSLQLVVEDSEWDWIRYAKVEGSVSPNGPWTHIVNVGKQGANLNTELVSNESGWIHTISYCYSGSNPDDAPLNVDARYLKITYLVEDVEINKWTRISEICINSFISGNDYTPIYMASENNPTFEAAREARGYSASNLIDGNVRTTYKPEKQEAGSLLYRLSEDIDKYNMLNILQSPGTISNADVLIREANSNDFIKIGSLSGSMNEFNVSSFETIAEIKLEWKNITPELHELLLSEKTPATIDKTELNKLIEKAEAIKTDDYAIDLVEALNKALTNAKLVSSNNYVMQSKVEQAARDLSEAISALLDNPPADKPISLTDSTTNITVKADAGILPNTSELFVKQIKSEGLYDVAEVALKTIASKFMVYDISVKADSVIVKPQNGNATILIPIPSNYDNSLIKVYEIDGSGNLTDISYKIDNNNITFDTDHFSNGTAFIIAERITVVKDSLKVEITKAQGLKKSDYEATSWDKMQEALKSAIAIRDKQNATQTEVDKALNELKQAIEKLVTVDIKSELKIEIIKAQGLKESDYEATSWDKMQEALKSAIAIRDKQNATQTEVDKALNELKQAIEKLVIATVGSKGALNQQIERANLLDKSGYKVASWNKMQEVLKSAIIIRDKQNATQDEIDKITSELTKAIDDLVIVSGSSGGGSSSSSSNSISDSSTTDKKSNDDIVSEKTEVNEETGETTNTKEIKDGTIIKEVIKSDGSYIATAESKDGVKAETTADKDGEIEAIVTLPSEKQNKDTLITIPLNKATVNTVVMIVKEDGSTEIVRKSIITQNGVMLKTNNSAKYKIVDNSKEFDDTLNHWAKTSIQFVTSRMLFQGTSKDEFSPNKSMTRAMLITVLHRLENEPKVDTNISFNDVDKNQYYSNAVAWASENNIISKNENEFKPNEDITREQLISILYRYSGSPKTKGNIKSFNDNEDVSSWANDAMVWAAENNIISGNDKKELAPKANVTRAEVASIFERFIESLVR